MDVSNTNAHLNLKRNTYCKRNTKCISKILLVIKPMIVSDVRSVMNEIMDAISHLVIVEEAKALAGADSWEADTGEDTALVVSTREPREPGQDQTDGDWQHVGSCRQLNAVIPNYNNGNYNNFNLWNS